MACFKEGVPPMFSNQFIVHPIKWDWLGQDADNRTVCLSSDVVASLKEHWFVVKTA
jgi:hypothetical protein